MYQSGKSLHNGAIVIPSPAIKSVLSSFASNAFCKSSWSDSVHHMSPQLTSATTAESTHSSSSWLVDVAMNLNWFIVFGVSSVPYQFGLVTPVHSVIVYGVFPVFTLNTYSIPGFTVPAVTVKSLDGVTLFDMSSIVRVLHVSVTHSKSLYCISHDHPPHPHSDHLNLSWF